MIGETGDTFRLYLGGGVVTNGINCAMLGYSVADADLASMGKGGEEWEANKMQAGLVTVGYAGACLFAGQANGTDQTLLVGAELKFTTGFTGGNQWRWTVRGDETQPVVRAGAPAVWTYCT